MTNTEKLNQRIDASGYKRSYIAKTMGVTTRALSMKIRNITEFKASEINALCQLLGIVDPVEMEAIFFASEVD